jgi:hypothetical protein
MRMIRKINFQLKIKLKNNIKLIVVINTSYVIQVVIYIKIIQEYLQARMKVNLVLKKPRYYLQITKVNNLNLISVCVNRKYSHFKMLKLLHLD